MSQLTKLHGWLSFAPRVAKVTIHASNSEFAVATVIHYRHPIALIRKILNFSEAKTANRIIIKPL